MKQLSFFTATLLLATTGFAKVPPTVTCQASKVPLVVLANLATGDIKVIDTVSTTVTVERKGFSVVKKGDEIVFQNSKYKDLPAVVFTLRLNNSGFGVATSFDDRGGGHTTYKCVTN